MNKLLKKSVFTQFKADFNLNVTAQEKCGKGSGPHWLCSSVPCSSMSDSLRPHGLESTRLLCPWDFPGKNIRAGCHFLLQGIFPGRQQSGEAGMGETALLFRYTPQRVYSESKQFRKQAIFLLCSQSPLRSGRQGEEPGQVAGYAQDSQLAFFRNKKHFRPLLPPLLPLAP